MSDDLSREATSTLRRLRHDMRTSLGQIMGYSEMLQEDAEERELNEMVADLVKIHGSAKKLLDLVDEIFQPEGATLPPKSAAGAVPPADTTDVTDLLDAGAVGAAGRLLVVDDDANNRDILVRRLGRAGYNVTTAEDGEQALNAVGTQDFDLVLLDVMMPGIDGFEVLSRLRRSHTASRLPVIMATALTRTEDTVRALKLGANDFVAKPFDLPVVLARVATQLTAKRAVDEVENLARQLQIRNAFIRRTLGRYVSDEIATDLLENPESFAGSGEKRQVSIVMCDLRGFSTMVENLSAVDVLRVLNNYLGAMAETIHSHHGTIDEFIGDAVLAFFGAPVARADDTERAAACTLAMQQAMTGVNERNRGMGLPDVELGIGMATGDVIVGTIGSEIRSKYGAIGSAVNLAARIESYTLGGEILICPETHARLAGQLTIAETRNVKPKGFDEPIAIHRIVGMEGRPELTLEDAEAEFTRLEEHVAVGLIWLEGKEESDQRVHGTIHELSRNSARIVCDVLPAPLTDLRLQLFDADRTPLPGACYGKAVADPDGPAGSFTLRFTARSPALVALIRQALSGS